MVLELARGGADVKAVVGFHPRLATRRPHDAPNIKGKVLMSVGAEDPLISVPERLAFEEEMRAGGVDWRMNLYGGAEHSFTRPGAELDGVAGISHHQLSDTTSSPTPPALRRAILASDARPLPRGVQLNALPAPTSRQPSR